jgi:hypothetical protein
MKKLFIIAAVAATALLSSCAGTGTVCGMGGIYTDVKEGVTATSNSVGTKVGTASATNILGIIATGDASISTAASNGGVKKISHIDAHKKSILGIFATYEVFVYGE